MNDSDERIGQHYHSLSLSDNVMSEMIAQSQSANRELTVFQRIARVSPRAWAGVSVAACCLVMVFGLIHNAGVHSERTERALKEVAMNHSMRLELEFADASIDNIDEQMVLLPFDVSLPESVAANYTVKGARYCSLSGQLAAHIKLVNEKTDKTLSVFLTRAADELNAIDSSRETVDGMNVKIWRDSGLLYAMVGDHALGVQ